IKAVHLEGLRVIGDPSEFAQKYYSQGADELIYIDLVASLYGRSNLREIVQATAQNVFIPITVGGGIRSAYDVNDILRSGADKVAINTAVSKKPKLIKELSEHFGSQCIVLSIEAKQIEKNKWEVYTDNGREHTGKDVVEWAKYAVDLGAGEILLTSIDFEGTQKGFDIELTRSVSEAVSVPVIASGGMGCSQDLCDAVEMGKADAVSIAHVLHYDKISLPRIRDEAINANIKLRYL
ncbi:MAG: imidazole glycerol phosphate synthase subunit HisF, partial [Candidatus Marinimicrobia bacterium]|nr:imidazole glycerol phosphate synthase subunit HisF [Candidatus Neomarinimicrobiota bacterium]